MDKGMGIGLAIVSATVAFVVILGVEVALLPSSSGPPPIGPAPPTSVPIPAGTVFGLRNVTAGTYWAAVPFSVDVGSGTHLYRITGRWTNLSRAGVLVGLLPSPYYGPPYGCPAVGPCSDPFTYNGSLVVYLYAQNGTYPNWAAPTFLPYCSNVSPPPPADLTTVYYLIFKASTPDIVTVTQAFTVEAIPPPAVQC